MNQHFSTFGASPGLTVSRLDNGLTVATETIPGVATATLGVWVGAGSRHERPDEHGLSHLIEHMAFKGTATRSARKIAEDIENVGGEINAATSTESTSYTARVLGEDAGVALDVLGDILTRSVFDAGELARAKAQLKVSLLTALETPGGRIERNARQLLAWGRVIPPQELIAKVDAVEVEHVRAAGRTLLQGAPTLAAIGPVKGLPPLPRVAAALQAA